MRCTRWGRRVESSGMETLRWTNLETGAVWLFLYQHVVPLLDETKSKDPVLGCCSLLRLRVGTYLITASHVFDWLLPDDFDHIGIPSGPYHNDCTTLGPGVIRRTIENTTADVDVAIFPLSDGLVAKLEWDCLTPQESSSSSAHQRGTPNL